MTYLIKTKENEHEIEYSYGKKENDYIGSVSFDKNIKVIKEDSFKFKYYGENSFCRATISNNFLTEYSNCAKLFS